MDNPAALRDLADRLKEKIKSGIVVLGSVNGPKAFLIVGVTKDLTDRFHAGNVIKQIAATVGGSGGGGRIWPRPVVRSLKIWIGP